MFNIPPLSQVIDVVNKEIQAEGRPSIEWPPQRPEMDNQLIQDVVHPESLTPISEAQNNNNITHPGNPSSISELIDCLNIPEVWKNTLKEKYPLSDLYNCKSLYDSIDQVAKNIDLIAKYRNATFGPNPGIELDEVCQCLEELGAEASINAKVHWVLRFFNLLSDNTQDLLTRNFSSAHPAAKPVSNFHRSQYCSLALTLFEIQSGSPAWVKFLEHHAFQRSPDPLQQCINNDSYGRCRSLYSYINVAHTSNGVITQEKLTSAGLRRLFNHSVSSVNSADLQPQFTVAQTNPGSLDHILLSSINFSIEQLIDELTCISDDCKNALKSLYPLSPYYDCNSLFEPFNTVSDNIGLRETYIGAGFDQSQVDRYLAEHTAEKFIKPNFHRVLTVFNMLLDNDGGSLFTRLQAASLSRKINKIQDLQRIRHCSFAYSLVNDVKNLLNIEETVQTFWKDYLAKETRILPGTAISDLIFDHSSKRFILNSSAPGHSIQGLNTEDDQAFKYVQYCAGLLESQMSKYIYLSKESVGEYLPDGIKKTALETFLNFKKDIVQSMKNKPNMEDFV
ncbi:hypothetical protein CAGGBEG34_320032 [Candidatus Glomeribacter gigasporarum BEG34]|uniref:Uncharacterized protein n=1 Tax=Candidatus Glomeribacter gigasporarum BEG34 TaxID=1070319 RepID=G2JAU8_9BURK|nr:hypothetical protein [Candidatus Glomeribacter gigasporarum]CCD29900.1 hypothetical protein CAGGBEG34_320032 [Candidatus Glomeribacter gigasporarum BEG34]